MFGLFVMIEGKIGGIDRDLIILFDSREDAVDAALEIGIELEDISEFEGNYRIKEGEGWSEPTDDKDNALDMWQSTFNALEFCHVYPVQQPLKNMLDCKHCGEKWGKHMPDDEGKKYVVCKTGDTVFVPIGPFH